MRDIIKIFNEIYIILLNNKTSKYLKVSIFPNLMWKFKEFPEKIDFCFSVLKHDKTEKKFWNISSECDLVLFSRSILSNYLWPNELEHSGFTVLHHLPELAQTHVHWVGDAIQPSHLLSSPFPPAFNLSQHQGLFQRFSSSHQVTKYWCLASGSVLPTTDFL